MKNEALLVLGLLVGTAAIALFVVYVRLRSRSRISAAAQVKLQAQWQHVLSLQDPVRRVLEADKVVDHLLKELGYTGSFADKLRSAGPRLPNEQALWDAHKLRNRLAHDPGASVNAKQAEKALTTFAAVLRSYISL